MLYQEMHYLCTSNSIIISQKSLKLFKWYLKMNVTHTLYLEKTLFISEHRKNSTCILDVELNFYYLFDTSKNYYNIGYRESSLVAHRSELGRQNNQAVLRAAKHGHCTCTLTS